MKEQIQQLQQDFNAVIETAQTTEQIEAIRVEFLGRKQGKLKEVMKGLKDLPIEEKKEIGPLANAVRQQMEAAIEAALSAQTESTGPGVDLTLPGIAPAVGHIHPLTQIRNDLEDLFTSMGFMVFEGPELDNDFYNFEALNIPDSHPARDMQDTFFIESDITRKEPRELPDNKWVMRTHTSNMQVRIMEQFKPPIRAVILGRVFRNEAIDATHGHTFNQMECIVVDEAINVGNLTWTIREYFRQIIGEDAEIRLRPGFFPFTEPSYEVDAYMPGVKKNTDWIEMGGSGMIHPNVLKAAGYPEGKYTGFAFGMGYDRLAMMKYGITDIRDFTQNDIRFLEQF